MGHGKGAASGNHMASNHLSPFFFLLLLAVPSLPCEASIYRVRSAAMREGVERRRPVFPSYKIEGFPTLNFLPRGTPIPPSGPSMRHNSIGASASPRHHWVTVAVRMCNCHASTNHPLSLFLLFVELKDRTTLFALHIASQRLSTRRSCWTRRTSPISLLPATWLWRPVANHPIL